MSEPKQEEQVVDHNYEELEGIDSRVKKDARKWKVNINNLKSGGYIKQRQKDLFTVRCKAPGGRLPLSKMRKILEVAEKYGGDYVHLSFRQSVEIPYVHIENFDTVKAELAEAEQEIASCGPRVRVPTACSGCEYNPNGLTDTQKLAAMVDEKYFGIETSHKFKVSFSGCPIDCARTKEMDLGFQGIVEPKLIEEDCNGCTLCVKACQEGALEMVDELPVRDWDKCISCGDCIKACPFDAMLAAKIGHIVRVGGKHGKHPREANTVYEFATDEDVPAIIEKTIVWYNNNAGKRERIGTTIDRLGVDKFKKEVFGG